MKSEETVTAWATITQTQAVQSLSMKGKVYMKPLLAKKLCSLLLQGQGKSGVLKRVLMDIDHTLMQALCSGEVEHKLNCIVLLILFCFS